LRARFTEVGQPGEIELYPASITGFAFPSASVYEQAGRRSAIGERLIALYRRRLG